MFSPLVVLVSLTAVAECQSVVRQPVPVVTGFQENNQVDNFQEPMSDFSEFADNEPQMRQAQSAATFDSRANNRVACGFSCTRSASMLSFVDETFSSAACGDPSADVKVRCPACCEARGLAAGIMTIRSSGFLSANGRDCICCHNNPC